MKSFLLRFKQDRRRWRHWLFKACRRYQLSVLNYIATSNHIHLLVYDQGKREVARSMQLIASRTAQEFNRRKRRQGAFWEDRYHATAVESDVHLLRCMTYIDLNMVRAGVVEHPSEWEVSGFSEIQRPWQRKGVIDFPRLREILSVQSDDHLAQVLLRAAESERSQSVRNPVWTESPGVGSAGFVAMVRNSMGPCGRQRR